MTDSEITLSVLREIRDSIRTLDSNLSTRIDRTNERIDALSDRVDQRFEQVDKRFGVVETALTDVGAQLLLITRYLKNRTEVELQELKARVTTLEAKVG